MTPAARERLKQIKRAMEFHLVPRELGERRGITQTADAEQLVVFDDGESFDLAR